MRELSQWLAWSSLEADGVVYQFGEALERSGADVETGLDLAFLNRVEHISRAELTVPPAESVDVLFFLVELSEGELLIADLKRVKRTAFGFHRFDHYRIRALLYAGQPNWDLLDSVTPP